MPRPGDRADAGLRNLLAYIRISSIRRSTSTPYAFGDLPREFALRRLPEGAPVRRKIFRAAFGGRLETLQRIAGAVRLDARDPAFWDIAFP